MMNDTKEIQAYYESVLVKRIESLGKRLKKEGFHRDTYTELRFLENDIKCLNSVKGFVDAWHSEGEQALINRRA